MSSNEVAAPSNAKSGTPTESPSSGPDMGKGEAPDTAKVKAMTPRQERDDFIKFLIKLAVIVLIVRSFIFSPFSIPSESMQPRLLIGDFLIVNKMAYGFSRYSLPFGAPLIPGRIFASLPDRGDVVVFKAPPTQEQDYIKRVIGLPGDRIQVTGGQVILNGKPIVKLRVADALIPVTENMREAAKKIGAGELGGAGSDPCYAPRFHDVDGQGNPVCRYPRYRETLPGGRQYDVLDLIDGGPGSQDDTGVFIVPADHVFMMGDNRDRSADSRFPAVPGAGIGMVPVVNLVGKAEFTVFSTGGPDSWYNPVNWFEAARWNRIGQGF